MIAIIVLAVIGFALSLYALYVERRLEHNSKYVPLCDIRKNVSCSKAFSSDWGNMLGLPNSFYGMVYYVTLIAFAYQSLAPHVFYMSILGAVASAGLGLISYVIQRNYCVVCTAVYAVNFLILGIATLQV